MTIRMIAIALGMTLGNYIAQQTLHTYPDFGVAFDRSIFQCVAVFCVWLSLKLAPAT